MCLRLSLNCPIHGSAGRETWWAHQCGSQYQKQCLCHSFIWPLPPPYFFPPHFFCSCPSSSSFILLLFFLLLSIPPLLFTLLLILEFHTTGFNHIHSPPLTPRKSIQSFLPTQLCIFLEVFLDCLVVALFFVCLFFCCKQFGGW